MCLIISYLNLLIASKFLKSNGWHKKELFSGSIQPPNQVGVPRCEGYQWCRIVTLPGTRWGLGVDGDRKRKCRGGAHGQKYPAWHNGSASAVCLQSPGRIQRYQRCGATPLWSGHEADCRGSCRLATGRFDQWNEPLWNTDVNQAWESKRVGPK